MTFLTSPSWFLLLPLALLPIFLWWLFRRRRSEVRWSANFLLRKTLQQTATRNLWRQAAILALRTLVLILVILALARPFIPKAADPDELPHGDGVLHQVVLVDNSLSMSIPYRSFSRDEEMRSRLRTLLERMRPGDVCEVIPLASAKGERLEPIRLACPVSEEALQELERSLVLLDRPAGLLDGLQLAAERFHVTRADHRHLILLSDLTARDIPASASLRSLRDELVRLGVSSVAYEIQDKPRDNLAILNLRHGGNTLYAGWQYHLYIDIRNYGDAAAASTLTVRIRHGEQTLESRQVGIDLGPSEQRTIDLPITVPDLGEAGEIEIVAELTDHGAAYDNVRRLRLHVEERANLLLVTDPGDAAVDRDLWRDSYYVKQALTALTREVTSAPGPQRTRATVMRRDPTGNLVPTTVDPGAASLADATKPAITVNLREILRDDLQADDVADADVVILLGINDLDAAIIERLRVHVERGGGLLVGLGPAVFEDTFNASLSELTGTRLAGLMDPANRDRREWEYDKSYRQIEKTFDDPVLRPFLSEQQGPIENVRLYNHFRAETGSRAQPLMTLNNGDPLLLQNDFGRGAVLTWTSTLGGTWNTLAARNMYPNILYACLTRCLNGANLPRNLSPGEPLILSAPPEGAEIFIATPVGGAVIGPLAPREVHGRELVRFDDTQTPGIYRILMNGEPVGTVTVFESPAESDTRGVSPELRDAFSGAAGITVLSDWSAMAGALDASERSGESPVSAIALIILLALLLDAVLTRRWFT